MSRFQTLVIRALLILIKMQYLAVSPVKSEFYEDNLDLKQFVKDAEAALEESSS